MAANAPMIAMGLAAFWLLTTGGSDEPAPPAPGPQEPGDPDVLLVQQMLNDFRSCVLQGYLELGREPLEIFPRGDGCSSAGALVANGHRDACTENAMRNTGAIMGELGLFVVSDLEPLLERCGSDFEFRGNLALAADRVLGSSRPAVGDY